MTQAAWSRTGAVSLAVLAALAAIGAVATPSAAGAQTAAVPARDWSPDDRTVVGDFSHVTAVAAAMDRVFVASPTGLAIYEPQFRRWQGIVQPPANSGFERVFAGVVDPLDGSLWLAWPGGWLRYQPDLRTWDQGVVPGGVRDIAFDLDAPAAGAYLRTAQGWMTVPRGGGFATPSGPPTRPAGLTSIGEALRSNPGLQANSSQILLDNRMRSVRYTAASRSFDRQGWFLGTWGLGLLYLPEGSAFPQRLPFGLPGERVGAVFAAPNGVWVATDRDPNVNADVDAGLTFVGNDLTQFQTVPPPSSLGYSFVHAYRLVGQGRALWAATDNGVARIDPESGHTDVVDEGRGLPDARVFALASSRGRLTVGTAHGLARVADTLRAERLAKGFVDAAYAVSVRGDSTWVGTGIGLFVLADGSNDLVQPAALGASALFRTAILDLAWLGDTLVALTHDQLLYRDGRNGWALGPPLSPTLGRLRNMAVDRGGLWVAGERGVGFARLQTPALRPLLIGDLPSDPTSLAVDGDYLWVGTTAGLVRWRLDAIRP